MNIYLHTKRYFVGICRKLDKSVNTDDSISSLIYIPLTQSQCIKFGTHVEKLLRNFISLHSHVDNIRPQNKKGESERDHLFEVDGRKIYAELKCNLNLDTEKRKKTCEKIQKISKEENCNGYLLGLRYINNIPAKILKQYEDVNVISVTDYFRLFGIPCPFNGNELNYKIWLNQVAREIVCLDGDIESRIKKMESDLIILRSLKV